jgi:uncharacterized protein (DUF433 family)
MTMATTPLPERQSGLIERTEHPHVVKSADTLGGEPRVEGTRMPVRRIAAIFAAGTTVEEIIRDFPRLTPAQIHDAISYALDHPEEMEYHEQRDRLRHILRRHNLIYYDGRTLLPQQFAALDVPADAVYYTWETLPPELDE